MAKSQRGGGGEHASNYLNTLGSHKKLSVSLILQAIKSWLVQCSGF